MTEKIIHGKKNGMMMLLVIVFGIVASVALLIVSAMMLEAENMLGGWLLAVWIYRLLPDECGLEGAQTPGGPGTDPVW